METITAENLKLRAAADRAAKAEKALDLAREKARAEIDRLQQEQVRSVPS